MYDDYDDYDDYDYYDDEYYMGDYLDLMEE